MSSDVSKLLEAHLLKARQKADDLRLMPHELVLETYASVVSRWTPWDLKACALLSAYFHIFSSLFVSSNNIPIALKLECILTKTFVLYISPLQNLNIAKPSTPPAISYSKLRSLNIYHTHKVQHLHSASSKPNVAIYLTSHQKYNLFVCVYSANIQI